MAIDLESIFYGRDEELTMLQEFKHRDTAFLIVIKGRRRIGKSRLLREYASSFKQAYIFTGLPPDKKTTAESQRREFAGQLRRHMNIFRRFSLMTGLICFGLWPIISKKVKC